MRKRKLHKKNQQAAARKAFVFEELEPRVLLSADLPLDLPDTNVPEEFSDQEILQDINAQQYASPAQDAVSRELIFVDTDTPEYQTLLSDLLKYPDETSSYQVFELDNTRDGIAQITEILGAYKDVSAVHILSHGTEAAIDLGGSTLDSDALAANADRVSSWGSAFSEDGDILIYGCNLAATSEGKLLVNSLATLTNTDVAASDDLTGNTQLGGDWELEYQRGEVDTSVAISAAAQQHWVGTLQVETFQEGVNGYASTVDTYINEGSPAAGHGNSPSMILDNNPYHQVLIRFDDIFGSGPNQIPLGSTINSASLDIYVTSGVNAGTVSMHSMLIDWGASPSWNSLGSGIQVDGSEANAAADSSISSKNTVWQTFTGLASALQAWSDGAANYGWVMELDKNGTWAASSSEAALNQQPRLTVDFTPASDAPTITNLSGDSLAYSKGDGSQFIDQGGNAVVADTDSTDFDTGDLTVSLTSGGDSSEDVLAIHNEGIAAGEIGVSGSDVTYGGTVIGTWAGGTGGIDLTVTFDTDATATAVTALVRNITYENTDTGAPTLGDRTVSFAVSDGDGGTSLSHEATVSVIGVNQTPVNTVPGDQTTAQDASLTFSTAGGNQISVSDLDAGANEVEVTLSVTNGTLSLNLGVQPVGVEVLSNTETANAQISPDIAYAADGSYAVVWTSSLQDGDSGGIYYQRYDASGNKVGGEIQVNTITAQNQESPMIAMDDAGNAVVIWESFDEDWNNTWGVIGQRFDAAGNKVGTNFIATPTITSDQSRADVAMDAAGNFTVVWTHNSNEDIRIQRYAADGTTLGVETTVSTWVGIKVDPRIAMDDTGNSVVVWYTNGEDGDSFGVYGQRVDAAGNLVGSEFRVNTETVGSQDAPAVAMDANGDFVVVWRSNTQDGSSYGVYAKRYDSAGVAQGSEFLVNETTLDSQSNPDVAMDAAGNFTIAWHSNLQDGSGYGVYARQYDSAGTAQTGEFLINTTTSNNQSNPSISMTSTGDFGVAWSGNGPGDTSGISLQRYQQGAGGNSFSAGDGADDATMTFTGTIADINTALEGMTYTPNTGYNGVDVLTITTDDQGNTGTGGALQDIDTVDITVGNPNAPVIDLNGGDGGGNDYATTWTEDGGAVTIVDTDATLIDGDENLTSVTVTITNLLDGTAESLSANAGATGLSVNYNSGAGMLTISGAGTAAQYQQVLRTVTYNNTSNSPDTTARIITFTATDAISNGNTASTTLTVQATNDAPVNTVPVGQSTPQDTDLMFSSGNSNALSVGDVDAGSNEIEVTLSVDNGSLSVSGGGSPVGNEFLVNTTVTDTQLRPATAMREDGSFVMAWSSNNQDGSGYGVFAQRFDVAGNKVGIEFQVNTYTSSIQSDVAVAVDDAGNFTIVWKSYGQDKNNTYGIYGQRYDANGNTLGGEFPINTYTTGDQADPDIAMDASGNFVVVWSGESASDAVGIHAQLFDSSGNAVGAEISVNSYLTDLQEDPTVAMDDSGNFVVVWRSDNQDGDAAGIYAQRFNASGVAQGLEFRVNATTTSSQYWSDVAMDADGDFVVAWTDSVQGLMARVYDSSGIDQTGEFSTGIAGSNGPTVAMDANGNFTVARPEGTEISARSFDVTGTALGDVFQVNTTSPGIQPEPDIAMNGSGEFIIAWDGTGPGDTSGIFAQKYAATGITFTTGDGIADATMTFTGTVADINAALEGLTYTPGAGFNGTDTLTITTNDLGNTGSGGPLTDVDTVNITVGNLIVPVVDLNGGDGAGNDFAATWTEDGGAVSVVDTDASLTDSDENLASLTVTITNILDGTAESLAANAGVTGLSVNYNSGTGTLTISGAGTAAQYQQVLRTVTYNNTSDNPDTTARIITFTPTDALSNGNTATTTVSIAAVNDDPTNAGSMPSDLVFLEDTQGKLNLSAIDLSDVDAGSGNLTLTITSANGHLQTLGWPGLTLGGSQSVLILTGNLTDLNDFLNDVNSIDYEHATPNISGNNVDLITIEISDNGNTGSGGGGTITLGTINIDVTAVNDSPTVATNNTPTFANGSTGNIITVAMLNEGDPDDSGIGITYTLDTAPVNGRLYLSGIQLAPSATFTQDDINAGRITYDHNGTATVSDSFDFTLSDGGEDGTTTVSDTFNLNISAANSPPLATNLSAGETYTEDIALNLVDIVITDVDSENVTATLTLSDAGGGTLSTGTSGAVTSTFIGGVWTASGAIADVNTLLAGVVFTPIQDYNSNFTIVTSVDDGVAPAITGVKNMTGTAVNDAPVLDNSGSMTLGTLFENDITSSGDLVSDIIASAGGDRITDADSVAVEGIALTVADNSNGTWQYSTNGGGLWTDVGTVSDSSALVLTTTGSDRLRFVPNHNFNGAAGMSFRAWDTTDGNGSGTTGVDASVNGGSTAYSTVTGSATIGLIPVEVKFLFATKADVSGSGTPGADAWTNGDIVAVGDPNFNAEPGTSNGTVYDLTLGYLNTAATAAKVEISAMHLVMQDVTVGNTTTLDLLAGDMLLAIAGNERFTGTDLNAVDVDNGDVFVFRPDTPRDYTAGTFFMLLKDMEGSGKPVSSFTMVEQTTTVGGTPLQAGTFLFSHLTNGEENHIHHYVPDEVGATTSGVHTLLVDGDAIGLGSTGGGGQAISGLDIIEETALLSGGTTLNTGDLLVTLTGQDSTGPIFAQPHDIIRVTLTANETNGGTAGTGGVVLEGADFGLDSNNEEIEALTSLVEVGALNDDPVITLPGDPVSYTENNVAVIIDAGATLTDVDSTDFYGGALSVDFTAGGMPTDRLAINHEGTGIGQVGVSGNTVSYGGISIGTFTGGHNGTQPLVITFFNTADQAAVQAVMRNITYENVSDNPGSGSRTVRFVLTDGDGGTSNVETETINVTDANDAPVNTVPGPQVTDEDVALVFSSGNGNQIQIDDVDADGSDIEVILNATNGAITLSGITGLNFTTGDGSDDTAMTFTGTVAEINAALNGLSFTPDSNYNGPAGLEIITDDQGNTGPGGVLTDTDTVDITVNAVNDAPTLDLDLDNSGGTGGSDYAIGYAELSGAQLIIDTDAVLGDVDLEDLVSMTVTITNLQDTGAESLSADTLGTNIVANYNALTGELILTGADTVAKYQQVLRTIRYDNSSANPNTTARIVTFVANDGTDNSNVATTTISINNTNDAPVNTVPGLQVTNEDTALVFSSGNSNQILVADIDASGNDLEITLNATNGAITLAGTTGLNFTSGDGTFDTTMTFTGTVAEINVALNGLVFSPATDFNGTASLEIITDDQGNTGTGGVLTDTDTVDITVNAVIDVANDVLVTNEDTVGNLNVLTNDSFGPGATVTAVTQGTNGTVAFLANGDITYTPAEDFNGSDSFTYTVTTAAGDTEVGTVNVTVTAVVDVANDVLVTNEDTAGNLNVLTNDSFGPGATVTAVTQGTNGTVAFLANGDITYTPAEDFNGSDSFTYTVTTAAGDTEVGTVNVTVNAVVDMANDVLVTNEDAAGNLNVLTNDSFGPGATVTAVTQGTNGTVAFLANGDITYTPAEDFNGSDSFTYTVTTAAGDTEVGTVNVTVNSVVDVANDVLVTNEDAAGNLNVLTNDSFGPGATVTGVTQGTNGTVTFLANGDITYTPAEDFNGSDSFTYTVTTAAGDTEVGTVNVTVNAVVDTVNDVLVTSEDTAGNINVLTNDSFGPGATVTAVTQGTNGTVAFLANGDITYTPAEDFNGSDSFTYTVTTAAGDTEVGTVNVTVNAVTDVANDGLVTNEDTVGNLNVLTNDSFGPGATVTAVTQGTNGTVAFLANGDITYTPAEDYHGADSFTYTVTTAAGDTEVGTVNVTVNAVTDVANDALVTNEDTVGNLNVLTNDSFGPGATVTAVTQGTNGTVAFLANGDITYTPAEDFNGSDSFTYTVTTAAGDTEVGTVNVTVNAVVDVANDVLVTNEDAAGNLNVLTNDSFGPGATVTAVTQGTNGTVAFLANGDITYTPAEDFNGSDSFTYTVTTAAGDTEVGTVNVTVNSVVDVANDVLVTNEDAAGNLNVLTNDSFGPGATVTGVTQGTNGTVTFLANGDITYTPAEDFNGSDSFTYTVTTAAGDTEVGTVNVTVNAVVDTVNDVLVTSEDTVGNLNVLTNDSFGPGATVTAVTQGTNGTVAFLANGDITYTPAEDFNGSDSFTYTVTTAAGDTEVGTVNVTVNAVTDVANDGLVTNEDTVGNLNVLTNDSFGPGATVTAVTQGTNGTVAFLANGDITYTPAEDYHGADSFTYTVTTAAGDTEVGTVNVTVNAVTDVANDALVTNEDTVGNLNVLTNDSFGPGATVTAVTQGTNGTVAFLANGDITYTPAEDFNGSDSFTYTVTTAAGDTEVGTVNVTVNAVVDMANDVLVTNEDAAGNLNVLTNDSFGPGATVTAVTQGTNGTVAFLANGDITYTPAEDFNGSDSFTYTVTTAAGDTEVGTVNVTVNAVVDVANDVLVTNEDAAGNLNVLTNDSFGSGATMTAVTQGTNGTVAFLANGDITYTPAEDFNGPDSFTYTVTTAAGDTEVGTVNVTVNAVVDVANDVLVTNEDTVGNLNVLTNDSFGSGATVTAVTQGTNGTVAFLANGDITYTPAEDYHGTDSFTYTVTTAAGDAEVGTVNVTVNAVVDVANDVLVTNEDTVGNLNVLTNDSFGSGATVTAVTQGTNGTVAFLANGDITYTPAEDYHGTDSFTYTVTTAAGDTEVGTVNVTVNAVVDVSNDVLVTNEDTAGNLNVLTNDSFGPGATVTAVTQGTNGTVAFLANGDITYTPAEDYHGADSFTYTVTTAAGDTEVGTVNVTVNAVGDIVNDVLVTNEDTAGNLNVLTNDSFGPGATVTAVTQGSNGTVAFLANGDVTYTPGTDSNGADSFTYTVTTAAGDTEIGSVNVTINAVNDAPMLDLDQDNSSGTGGADFGVGYIELEGPKLIVDSDAILDDVDSSILTSLTVTLTNPQIPAEESLSADTTGTTIVANYDSITGILSLTGTIADSVADYQQVLRTIRYDNATTNPDTTPRIVTFVANDGTDDSNIATTTISIIGANDAPMNTVPGPQVTDEDSALVFSSGTGNEILVFDFDAYGNDLEVTLNATNGILTLGGITGLNFTNGDGTDDATMTFTGTVTEINAALDGLAFTPDTDYNGAASLEIITNDQGNTGTGGALSDTDTVDITVNAVVDVVNDVLVTNEDTAGNLNVLTNDSFGPGATVTAVTQGTNGTVTFLANGDITYTPAEDYHGADSFTYTVTTTAGDTEVGTVNVTVNAVVDVANDGLVTNEDTVGTLNVLTNDSFGPGATVTAVTQGTNGTVAFLANGDITYTPAEDYHGADSFTYTVTSGGVIEVGTVNITVNAVVDVANDVLVTNEDTVGNLNVLANDSFGPGATVTAVTQGANGTVAFLANGDITYTPAEDFNGSDAFTYTVTTAAGDTEVGTVNVTVNAVNDAPTLVFPVAVQYGSEDTPMLFSAANGNPISVGDVDAGAADISVRFLSYNGGISLNGTSGLVFITGDGVLDTDMEFTGSIAAINAALDGLTFTPDAEFSGGTNFQMWVNDQGNTGSGGPLETTRAALISLTAVNDAPVVAATATDTGTEDIDQVYTHAQMLALIGAADVDDVDANLSVAISNVVNGTLVMSGGTGGAGTTFTFTPTPDFVGNLTFDYQISDDEAPIPANSAVGSATVALGAVNDAPVANNDIILAGEDTGQTAGAPGLMSNDTDPDGTDGLYVYAVNGNSASVGSTIALASGALLTVNADGSTSYNTNGAFEYLGLGDSASDSFTYTISDAGGLTSTATVTVFIPGANDAPVTNNVSATGDEDAASIDITLTGSDIDGTVNFFRLNGLPANGTLYSDAGLTTILATGVDYAATGEALTLYFVPNANWNGGTSFQYVAVDNGNLPDSTPDTATITVNPVNDAPVANDDSYTVNEDITGSLPIPGVMGNDTDAEMDTLTAILVSGPSNGTLALNPDGSWSYTPDSNFNGTDSITYKVSDGTLDSNVATATITVDPVNDAPVNNIPGGQTTSKNTPLVFAILDGNSISVADPDGAGTILKVTLTASNGTLNLSGTNGLVFNAGDGIDDATMTFTGTAADINAALDGLLFQPDTDYQGFTTVQLITDDLGNSGAGGVLNTLDSISISVVENAPVSDNLPPLDELIVDYPDLPEVDPDPVPPFPTVSTPAPVQEASGTASVGNVDTNSSDSRVTSGEVSVHESIVSAGGHADQERADDRSISTRIWNAITDPLVSVRAIATLPPGALIWDFIDLMTDQINKNNSGSTDTTAYMIGTTTTGVTFAFSAGYVSWLLRAGYLSAALLSSAPVWRQFDPLPILGKPEEQERTADKDGQDSEQTDDKKVDDIFEPGARNGANEAVS